MNYNLLSYDELLAQYRLLAGRANKRLERLEKAGMKTGSAYKSAQIATSRMKGARGSGRRFSLSNPGSVKALRGRMNEVKSFLSDVTSTPAGVRKVGQKIGGTLKSSYGLELTPEQIKATFEGALWAKLNNRFGSGTAVKIIAELQKSGGDVKNMLKSLQEQNIYLSTSEKKSLAATLGNYKRANKIGYLFPDEEE